MDTAKEELLSYVMDKNTSFYWYHNPKRFNDLNKFEEKDKINIEHIRDEPYKELDGGVVIHKHLNDFFESKLDEVRLKKANQFSKFALKISDNDLLSYFRVAASMREYGGDIDYSRQRDHAAHTLYNYILGWYIFDNNKEFKKNFEQCLVNKLMRCYSDTSDFFKLKDKERSFYIYHIGYYGKIEEEEKSIVLANEFGDVWSITSLLHDIGYILEGTIDSASIEMENVRISRGSKLIHDYFNHRFWKDTMIDYKAMQSIAKVLSVSVPDFRYTQSLASLGDHLCNTGCCENIRENLKTCSGFSIWHLLTHWSTSPRKLINEPYSLNCEAFSIWMTYYEVYGKTTNKNKKSRMISILEIVKKQYYDAMWSGANQGYKNLNHGVCSGAIVLKALSFFYDFVYGFEEFNTWNKYHRKCNVLIKSGVLNKEDMVSRKNYNDINSYITTRFLPGSVRIRGKRKADFWFNKVLWATASVAIHDITQKDFYEKICKKNRHSKNVKITLDEDPLAYLGVLVDALQEWDRYTVLGSTAFSNEEILQSNEAYIETNNDKTNFYYPKRNEKKLDEEIKDALNRCLDNWEEVINIDKPIMLDIKYDGTLIKLDGKLGVVGPLIKLDDSDSVAGPVIQLSDKLGVVGPVIKLDDKLKLGVVGRVRSPCGPITLTIRGKSKKYTWNIEGKLPKGLKLITRDNAAKVYEGNPIPKSDAVEVSGIQKENDGVFNIDVTVEDSSIKVYGVPEEQGEGVFNIDVTVKDLSQPDWVNKCSLTFIINLS